MTRTYPVKLTGHELRLVKEAIEAAHDDRTSNRTAHDTSALRTAHDKITAGWRTALRAESTPA